MNDPRDWVLRYQLVPEELGRAVVRMLPGPKAARRKARLVVVALLVPFTLLTAPVASNVIFGVVVPAVAVVTVLLTLMSDRQAIRSNVAMVKRVPSNCDPSVLTVEGEGVRVRTPSTDHWSGWPHWEGVANDADGVALILRGGWGIQFVPARAFAPGQQEVWARFVGAAIDRSAPVVPIV